MRIDNLGTFLEVIDFVEGHLLRQGERAQVIEKVTEDDDFNIEYDEPMCRYLTDDGKMCAVGCLLGDLYEPEMEGLRIYDLDRKNRWRLNSDQLALLDSLQEIHDECDPKTWAEKLDALRGEYGG